MGAANECIPYYEPGTRITGHASAAVVGKRVADISADSQSGPGLSATAEGGNIVVATAAARAKGIGVFSHDAARDEKVTVLCSPMVVPITAEAGITAGEEVQVGAAGGVVKYSDGAKIGRALATAADRDDTMVKLYD